MGRILESTWEEWNEKYWRVYGDKGPQKGTFQPGVKTDKWDDPYKTCCECGEDFPKIELRLVDLRDKGKKYDFYCSKCLSKAYGIKESRILESYGEDFSNWSVCYECGSEFPKEELTFSEDPGRGDKRWHYYCPKCYNKIQGFKENKMVRNAFFDKIIKESLMDDIQEEGIQKMSPETFKKLRGKMYQIDKELERQGAPMGAGEFMQKASEEEAQTMLRKIGRK